VLYFAPGKFEVDVTDLRFTPQGGSQLSRGPAHSNNGVISTRRGNGGSWTAVTGKSPFGQWELALPDTDETKNRFKDEQIEDILFVVTYSGRTPDWPA
jgi:hypothetical protein